MTYHGDASCQPYKYYTFTQAFSVREKGPRQAEHEERGDDPVHEDAEANLDPNLARAEDAVQGLILDLAQDRVHHDKQTDS